MPSEFGRGVVTCLAKFSEHLFMSETYKRVFETGAWAEGEAPSAYADAMLKSLKTKEQVLSYQISIWMNGASDHFYDLDRKRSPACLCELADIALKMGHGFMLSGDVFTMKDVERIRDLWMQSCLEIDKAHGVDAEWGTW